MGMYFVEGHRNPPSVLDVVVQWARETPGWSVRQGDGGSGDATYGRWAAPYRYAKPEEVAQELLNSAAVQAALGALSSTIGEAIEEHVLARYVGGPEARILMIGLDQALKIVKDRQRAVRERVAVLIGVACVVAGIILVVRHSRSQS